MDVAPGTWLQRRYRVGPALGRGSAATTYAADDQVMGMPVALKVLHDASPELIGALSHEVSRLRGLWHPRLARALDLGTDLVNGKRCWFMASERIDGRALSEHAAHTPWETWVQAVVDALDALAFLHHVGTRHGDVKPDNILITREGRGVLIDLGCARALADTRDTSPSGTPAFMAPEILQGDPIDERADLYALGKSLLALPVQYPAAVHRLLQQMCSAKAAERPTSAREVIERLGFPTSFATSIGGRSPRLVERDDVLAQSQSLVDALLEQRAAPRAWIIHGPDGIGRSRMLDEIKWHLQPHGTVVMAKRRDPHAVAEVLQRALGSAQAPRSLADVLAARDQLAARPQPTAILLDDAHLLPEDQRAWLIGLLRTTPDTGHLLLIVTDSSEQETAPQLQQTELRALSAQGLRVWIDGQLGDAAIPALMRLTGGFPAYVQLVLHRVNSGATREADIVAGHVSTLDVTLHVPDLAPADQAVLARLCANDRITTEQAHGFGLTDDALARCVSRGIAVYTPLGFSLRRSADADALRLLLPRDLIGRAHRDAAALIDDQAKSPVCVKHWIHAGDTARARDALIDASRSALQQPRRWLGLVTALAQPSNDLHFHIAAGQIALQAGEPRQALHHVAYVVRARPDAEAQRQARCIAADAYTQLGSVARAQAQLGRARELADATSLPPIAEREARLLIQRAAYRDAITTAQAALDHAQDAKLRARLYESLGVAWTYLGEREPALQALRQAERLHPIDDARARFRCASYRAMLELRSGRVTEAALGYGQALRLAETHGLADLYVNAALNVGSAAHALGDWGPTLASYERAIALAQAIAKHNTLASLRFNLANLYCEIGLFDRSASELTHCRALVERFQIHSLAPYLQRLDAELLGAQGRLLEARQAFALARTSFEQAGARRDVIEIDLELARLAFESGEVTECVRLLDAIDHAMIDMDADDVGARVSLLRGRTWVADGRAAEALPILERALTTARACEQRLTSAAILCCLADAHHVLGSAEQTTAHRAEAKAIYARVAATLPTVMRDAFYAHPQRRGIDLTDKTAPPATDNRAASSFDLSGFLEINRRINSSLTVDQVLSHAMDAAIALTGAERGFLLLVDDAKDVDVSVARNVDREHLGKAHMKFSRSIADEVMRTGEPLLTIDAGTDTRFAEQQSVHAMKLKSVVCVPIRSPRGVLGALYLDNRFQKARFRQEDVDVLMAFSDQVAIAITNARLHAELSQRTRELEEERRRVERLAKGQALEIDRLQHALAHQQQVLELRHDYSSIVSRSAAMREVLSTLDRVTDTNLSVLIQGESGTGKEVVARALHFNGPRRKQPFVSINCGALPEPLLESELFGHVKGAFTGADRDRAGLFVTARGGTLFLDEIGEMSTAMQVKLLRVLQEREVRRVGASKTEAIDVRVLGATNRELQTEVSAGRFREDLYYRLAVVEVTLPPLRERTEDIAELAALLLQRLSEAAQRKTPRLSADAISALISYPWPGNVRELENVLSRALIMSEGDSITGVDLALGARRRRAPARDRSGFEQDEATRLFTALTAHRWNVSAVSRQLGIPRNTLYRKLEKYRLTRDPS